MGVIDTLVTGGVFSFLGKALDKIFPDPEERAKAKAALMQAQLNGELQVLGAEMQVMLAEAQSEDKWTSRARPSFLYVVYIYILAAIPMGFMFAVDSVSAQNVITGVEGWLQAIPGEMWATMSFVMGGYIVSRSYDKAKLKEAATKIAIGK